MIIDMDLTNLLLFCDRIGDDQDYIMVDSHVIDKLLVDVDRATSAADGWDWTDQYMADPAVTDFMLQCAGLWNWDIHQAN